MFQRLFGRERADNRAIVDALYAAIVAAARQPAFYSDFGAPDTPLGRFEMIALHMTLVLRRLRDTSQAGQGIAQELVDQLFADVDDSLRELGIGDTGVPKRARKLASMFYGRVSAYGAAIDASDAGALAMALSRNIRPDLKDWPAAPKLADYTIVAASELAAQPIDAIIAGSISFPQAGAVRPHAA